MAAILAALRLGGCAVGPNYTGPPAPEIPNPAVYKSAAAIGGLSALSGGAGGMSGAAGGTTGGTGTTGMTGGSTGAPVLTTQPLTRTFHLFRVPADLNREIDLFGRVRRNYEAARADNQQQEADAQNMRLSVAANVAVAGHGLAAANARLGVAVAAFFPRINLTGAGGFGSASIGQLCNWERWAQHGKPARRPRGMLGQRVPATVQLIKALGVGWS